MILHGSKPSTRHCFHNPQVTNCKSTGETALVSFVQELSHVGKRALFISGSPAFKFINMLFLTSCENSFLCNCEERIFTFKVFGRKSYTQFFPPLFQRCRVKVFTSNPIVNIPILQDDSKGYPLAFRGTEQVNIMFLQASKSILG